MYDPANSRWLSPDPIKGNVRNPQSMVQYTYCLNNPITFIDPLGLATLYINGTHVANP